MPYISLMTKKNSKESLTTIFCTVTFHLYISFKSEVDNLSIKHQIAQKHQIDMDKTCQHHHNKQEHKMSTRARPRTTITTMLHPSTRSTSNDQQEEEEQLSQQCHS